MAEVFDVEAEGARYSLRVAILIVVRTSGKPKITVCLDNVAALAGFRGTLSDSSQKAFIDF